MFDSQGVLFRYSLSFGLIMGLLPTLIILFYIFQVASLDPMKLIEALYNYIPQALLKPFVEYLIKQDLPGIVTMTISLIIAIYIGSKSFYVFMLRTQRDSTIKMPNYVVRIKSVVCYVICLIAIIILSLISGLLPVPYALCFFIGMLLIIYVFYHMMFYVKLPFKYGIIGSITSSCLIAIVGEVFLFFIRHFTRYDSLYGPLVSLMIVLLAFYLISSFLYLGYCLNEFFYDHSEDDTSGIIDYLDKKNIPYDHQD
ncbi:MAG: YhjD/YihY/BrkB family envelope integrity protein [Thomasclavelia sp.]|nr:YhjD/YihY/BrkB family envelope integrity protein [Thomasclavelia sp.]